MIQSKFNGKSSDIHNIIPRRHQETAIDLEMLEKENRQLWAMNKQLDFQVQQFKKFEDERNKPHADWTYLIMKVHTNE